MILRIANTPRSYAWGSTTAIARLLGTESSGGPEAELWLGAHPGSPARIVDGAPEGDLAAWVQAHRADGQLPFLMKVLAASAPLSLQAHPTPQQARDGFERENAAGIPVDAPHRNYKDPFHKPELLYALSDEFRALSGFRPVSETRADLEATADRRLQPLLDRLADESTLGSTFGWLIGGGDDVDALVATLTDLAHDEARRRGDSASWDTVRRLAAEYPDDPGIAISMLMHTVVLRPGEAIYLPAGNIHAYLDGLGIEVMASSDNVLRGGLTPKHVDVPELLRVLDFRSLPAPYLEPQHPQSGISVFRPDVPDFALTVVDADALDDAARIDTGGAAIVLVLDGEVTVADGQASVQLTRGESAFVDGEQVTVHGKGRAVIGHCGQ